MATDHCEICGELIRIQIFKGTGYCCELHRKERERRKREQDMHGDEDQGR